MPFHLKELATLLETYPDAIIVQTHRDPLEFMGSWSHLIEQAQSILARPQEKNYIGADQLEFMSTMLNQAMTFRAANPSLESRWIDISYHEFLKDPMAAGDQIYKSLGRKPSGEARVNMQLYMQQQAASRKNEIRHHYTLGEYGLTAGQVADAFKPYLDFVKSRGIKVAKDAGVVTMVGRTTKTFAPKE